MKRGINHNCERCGKSHDIYDLGMYCEEIVCVDCFTALATPCGKAAWIEEWDNAQDDLSDPIDEKEWNAFLEERKTETSK